VQTITKLSAKARLLSAKLGSTNRDDKCRQLNKYLEDNPEISNEALHAVQEAKVIAVYKHISRRIKSTGQWQLQHFNKDFWSNPTESANKIKEWAKSGRFGQLIRRFVVEELAEEIPGDSEKDVLDNLHEFTVLLRRVTTRYMHHFAMFDPVETVHDSLEKHTGRALLCLWKVQKVRLTLRQGWV
jgi:hypothetical protein